MNYKVMNKYFGVEKENINFLKEAITQINIYDFLVKLCTLLEYTAYKGGAGLVMLLFGGVFVFVGLNMVFGLPIRRAIVQRIGYMQ